MERTEMGTRVQPQFSTIPEGLIHGASLGGNLTLPDGAGAEVRTFERLLEDGSRAATELRTMGVEPGDRVAIVAHSSFDFVTACIATWWVGGIVAPIPYPLFGATRPAWQRNTGEMLTRFGPKLVIAHGEVLEPVPGAKVVDALTLGDRAIEPVASPEHGAVVQFTSGSTGAPRAALVSHRAVGAFLSSYLPKAERWPGTAGVSWLPLYHDLGFFCYLLVSLAGGAPLTLLSTGAFLSEPLGWMRLLGSEGGTHTSAPNFAFGLVARHARRRDDLDLDLSGVRVAGMGGEAIDAATVRSFLDSMAPYGLSPDTQVSGYGLAEATCAVSFRPVGGGFVSDRVDREALGQGKAEPTSSTEGVAEFASVGTPLEGTEIKIVSRTGGKADQREVGEILVRGPSLMEGYLDDPEATESTFHEGWLKTGDLGYLADGELYITGRAKNLIIVRGQNYHAEDVEHIAERVEGVRKGCCVAVALRSQMSEEIGLVAETRVAKHEEEDLRKDIVRAIWSETGISPREVLLVPPGSLPKTTSGKLKRSLAGKTFFGDRHG